MTWLVYALSSIVAWGFWGMSSKVAVQRVGWIRSALLYYLVGLAVVAIVTVAGGTGPWSREGLLAAAAAGATGVVGLVCFYVSLGLAKASIVVPLTGMFPVVSTILSLVFLDESLSVLQLLGVGCACVGILLIGRASESASEA